MRLIDADALMQTIRQHDYPLTARNNSVDAGMFTIGIQQAVDQQPTVDAVEVVRCRDCEHMTVTETYCGAKYIECLVTETFMEENDYCSRGERRRD